MLRHPFDPSAWLLNTATPGKVDLLEQHAMCTVKDGRCNGLGTDSSLETARICTWSHGMCIKDSCRVVKLGASKGRSLLYHALALKRAVHGIAAALCSRSGGLDPK